jgi:long-chain fatty acid transport protein
VARRVLAFFLLVAAPATAQASGFALYEQSASALGRGAAVSASTDEPAAAFYNPAALVFVAGWRVSASGMLVRFGSRFSPSPGGADTDSLGRSYLVPALYAHVAVAERVRLALAVNVPFALAVAWPPDWAGARFATAAKLWALSLNPSLAYRLTDRLSVAAGLSAVRGSVAITTGLPAAVGTGIVDLQGSAWGVGANFALLLRLLPDRLHVSATYRSRVRLALSGRAQFSPENPSTGAVNQGARSTVTWPDIIVVGVMLRPLPALELGAEAGPTLWSTFDRLAIDFEQPNMRVAPIERGRRNPWSARLGGQWWTLRETLALRAGLTFDQSSAAPASLAPSGPDSERLGFCLGAGYRLGRVTLDLGYMFAHFLDSTAAPPPVRADGYDPAQSPAGVYRSSAHQLALTVSVRSQ